MDWVIKRFEVTNMLAISGDDIVFFEVIVSAKNEMEKENRVAISFDDLSKFLNANEPAIGKYLTRIRSSMNGYGPKQSKIIEVLYDEEFDFEKYLHQYMSSTGANYLDGSRAVAQNLSQKERQSLEEKMKQLDSLLTDNREGNEKYTEFLDKIDEALHSLTFQYYPSLFEKGEKHIAAYKHKLISTTMDFAKEIDRLMHDKFNDYWEQKWEQRKH